MLTSFVRAFNAGDWTRLSSLLPATADPGAPALPTPGMDATLFRGSWLTTMSYSGSVSSSEALATSAELIAVLRTRHASGERWEAGEPTIQRYADSPAWEAPDAAEAILSITRSADDLSERVAQAASVVNCRAGTIIFWQIVDDPLPPVAVISMSLNDIDDEPLRFLSADEHPYFEGYTLVHGALQIGGAGALSDVVLEVLEDGDVVATGELVEAAREQLLGLFDASGLRSTAGVGPLFRIDSTQFQAVDRDSDGWLTLRVRVTTSEGEEEVREYGTEVGKLVLYWGENRYILDEEDRGGNDWTQPSVRDIMNDWLEVQIGDFSDMNGGPYPPHVSHQTGLDVDVWFPGYNEMDAFTAETLLGHIDGQPWTARLDLVYATFEPLPGNPFWDVIAGYTLSDGRPATAVILPEEGHTGHFHLRFASLLDDE